MHSLLLLLPSRILSLLLSLCMLTSLLPAPAIAVDEPAEEVTDSLPLQEFSELPTEDDAPLEIKPEVLSLRYDDRYDVTGRTVEILNAGTPISCLIQSSAEEAPIRDTAVVTLQDNTLVASGVGTAAVKLDGVEYTVEVSRAKIQLVAIMGQSNAGNHFDNATSDITCAPGTAYWWGDGLGTDAAEPVPYTQPSQGFHAPLLAELYAQSAAAGDPVKNVMVWQEGITSKNGKPISAWAADAADTAGTDDTVTMIQNCLAYYRHHSDKFEIAGKGVYWLQGESDTATDPKLYTQRFLAVWDRLQSAGMEYLAFLRIRRGTSENDEVHNDLPHSASLSAQIRMVNDAPDLYMATTLTEQWVGTEAVSHTIDISEYITMMQTYGGSAEHTDAYGNDAAYADGKLTTTMKTLYGSNNKCHYGKFGYSLIGADAAYNMYRALHGEDAAIVVTTTSGSTEVQHIIADRQDITIDITDLTDNLSFRPACGSTAGTLDLTIRSGRTDITSRDGLIVSTGPLFGSVNVKKLKNFPDVSIEVRYRTAAGTVHTAVCRILSPSVQERLPLLYDKYHSLSTEPADTSPPIFP